jgi:hypothetical protein
VILDRKNERKTSMDTKIIKRDKKGWKDVIKE